MAMSMDELVANGRLFNPFSDEQGRAYSDGNQVHLAKAMRANGWKDPRFVTEAQIEAHNLKKADNAKAVMVLVKGTEQDGPKWQQKFVYNASQVIGLPSLEDQLAGARQAWEAHRGGRVADGAKPVPGTVDEMVALGVPHNPLSNDGKGKGYAGKFQVKLLDAMKGNSWSDPRFVTEAQIKAAGLELGDAKPVAISLHEGDQWRTVTLYNASQIQRFPVLGESLETLVEAARQARVNKARAASANQERADALAVLAGADQKARLAELYDDHPEVAEACAKLFPNFEYPNHSWKTIGVLCKEAEQREGRAAGNKAAKRESVPVPATVPEMVAQGLPFNPLSEGGHGYTGRNQVKLRDAMETHGWKDPRFVTEAQAKVAGLTIPTEAVSVAINVQGANGWRTVKVYNAGQIDGFPPLGTGAVLQQKENNQNWTEETMHREGVREAVAHNNAMETIAAIGRGEFPGAAGQSGVSQMTAGPSPTVPARDKWADFDDMAEKARQDRLAREAAEARRRDEETRASPTPINSGGSAAKNDRTTGELGLMSHVVNDELPEPADVTAKGRFVGAIVSVTDTHVIQKIGRDGALVSHERSRLDAVPKSGESATIKYDANGIGQVKGPGKRAAAELVR